MENNFWLARRRQHEHSLRGSLRKLGQEQKNIWRGRGGGKEGTSFFCFRSDFRAITRLETLAILLRRLTWALLFHTRERATRCWSLNINYAKRVVNYSAWKLHAVWGRNSLLLTFSSSSTQCPLPVTSVSGDAWMCLNASKIPAF